MKNTFYYIDKEKCLAIDELKSHLVKDYGFLLKNSDYFINKLKMILHGK